MNPERLAQLAADLVTSLGLKIVGALAVLMIGLAVARSVRGAARRALERTGTDATLVPFLSSLAYYLVLTFVGVAVLGIFGIQTASIIAVLGAAGLAIGLALQGSLSNLASGVLLLILRPFQVGQFIEAGGVAGTVEGIGVFATTLDTPDNVRIVVPNATIYAGAVTNYSANDTRRNDISLGISYSDDIGKAVAAIQAVLDADSRVLKDPAPVVAVSGLGDSSVDLVVRPWCKREDYWGLRFDLMRRLKEEVEAAGCSIPFPQRDVHLIQAGPAA